MVENPLSSTVFCGGFSSSLGPFCQRHVRWGFHIWDRPGLSPDQASPEVAGPDTWWKVSWWLRYCEAKCSEKRESYTDTQVIYKLWTCTSQESICKVLWFRLSFDALKPQFGYNCVPRAVSKFDERFSLIHVPTHVPSVFSRPWAWGTENADATGSFWQLLHTFHGREAMLGFCVVLRVDNGGTPHSKRVSWILF